MWDKRNARVVLVGKPEEKDHLKNSRHRWKNNALKGLSGLGQEGMIWIRLAQYKENW